MATLKIRKIPATTLLETMVALTIAVSLFGLVALLFGRLTVGSVSPERNRIRELLEARAASDGDSTGSPGGGKYRNADWVCDGYRLMQRFIAQDSLPGLLEGRFTLSDDRGRLLEEIDKWIIPEGQDAGSILSNR